MHAKILTCAELETYRAKGIKIVDVREPYEYDQGHLPGAINKPLSEFQRLLKDCCEDTDGQIFVYCRTGARSGMAAQILQMNGFDVINIGGVMHYPGCLRETKNP